MKNRVLLLIAILMHALAIPAYAQEELDPQEQDMEMLRLYYPDDYERMIATATRFPKPKGKIAENITVITKEEIKEMNAHTLGDVLDRVPGIQTDWGSWVGSSRAAYIQGSEFRHVTLKIDGVSLNNLSDNILEAGAIPVQNIERIEIIKGPASSVWGSSLGGVINIITKDASVRKLSGLLSASHGGMNTNDLRAEVSGRRDNFSYYLFGGNLGSHGMNPGSGDSANNLYSKFTYDISTKLGLSFTTGYNKALRGFGDYIDYDFRTLDNYEMLFTTLNLDYSINQDADLKLSLRKSWYIEKISDYALSTGESLGDRINKETNTGGNLNFSLRHGIHTVVLGADIEQGRSYANSYLNTGDLALNKAAVYANDTFSIGKLTITPGLRYDYVNTAGSFTSPSIGIVFKAADRTLLRLTTAKGFNIPSLASTSGSTSYYTANPDLIFEKIWSIQVGIETTAIKYLWLKATLFSHKISDIIGNLRLADGTRTSINEGRAKREGFEFEAKTLPVYNTSLFAGFLFVNTKDLDTGEKSNQSGQTYDIGLRYDDKKSLVGQLKGRYIRWTLDPASEETAKHKSFVWDINIIKKIYAQEKTEAEVFIAGHNIFNNQQYTFTAYKTPARWFEAGVNYRF